jgi:hypothetical protein
MRYPLAVHFAHLEIFTHDALEHILVKVKDVADLFL